MFNWSHVNNYLNNFEFCIWYIIIILRYSVVNFLEVIISIRALGSSTSIWDVFSKLLNLIAGGSRRIFKILYWKVGIN